MKRILPLILVTAILLTVQAVPVFADNTDSSYTLTAEDDKRLMAYDQYKEGSYYCSNEQFKASYELKNILDWLAVAEEHVELRENYDYRKIATEAGKADYKEAFMKYMRKNYTGSTSKFNKQVEYILGNELVKEATVSANPSVKEAKPTTSKVYVNGNEVSFTVYNIDGRDCFKLRDIARVIDFDVTWDGKTNTIGIDTSVSYTE